MTLHAGLMLHPKIIACQTCGFSHWHPLPDASTVARYYEDDKFYSQHSPPDWFEKELSEHNQGYWYAYYDYLASFLIFGKHVIDIGCGGAWFLRRIRWQEGYRVFGVEPSGIARKIIAPLIDFAVPAVKNLKELEGEYPNLGPVKGNIVLMLTLEHVLDPETWLREEILPHLDGRLIVVVPSEFNRLQKWLGGDWFVSPVHLNYFTRDSLRGLLERAGLKVVFEGATFPTEIWPLIGLDHRLNPEMGRRTHLWRLKLEKRFPGIFHLYGWLGRRWNIGREIIMVAEKK